MIEVRIANSTLVEYATRESAVAYTQAKLVSAGIPLHLDFADRRDQLWVEFEPETDSTVYRWYEKGEPRPAEKVWQ